MDLGATLAVCIFIAIYYFITQGKKASPDRDRRSNVPDSSLCGVDDKESYGDILADDLGGIGLELDYTDAYGDSSTRQISLHRIESTSGDWRGTLYLVAFCHLRNEPRTFRADRIDSLTNIETGETISKGIKKYLRELGS